MIKVVCLSVEEVSEMFDVSIDLARDSAIKCGGFAYTKFPKEVFEQYPKMNKVFNMNEDFILISSTIVSEWDITEDEVKAIILHEEGHCVLNHVDHNASVGIQYNEENEIESDNYCIEKGYGVHLYSALNKIIKGLCVEKSNEKGFDVHIQEFMNPRLTNIKNQI